MKVLLSIKKVHFWKVFYITKWL